MRQAAAAKPPTPAPPPATASRMTLASVVRGRKIEPPRILLYGVEGIGKSTFGANAPNPIFLGSEDGTGQLDVARFPTPERWEELLEAVRVLTNEKHEYGTLVLDTLDWAEPLLWAFLCKRDGEKSIESYGYGKGYNAAVDEWRVFIAALERLRRERPMTIVLIAHSWIKPFKNPEGDDFDRYELKIHGKAAGLFKEWCDAVLFANYETLVAQNEKKRTRGVDTGARLIYTQRRAAYDAKNRYGLPESLPLSWADFAEAIENHQPADPDALRAEIERKAKELGEALGKQALEAIKRANGDAVKLSLLNNWCNAKLAEKAEG